MNDQKKLSIIVSGSFIILIIIYVLAYDLDIYQQITTKEQMAALGQFGDFLGGTLNPLLALLTVIGLAYTIHLQRQQLHESQEQYNKNMQHTYVQQFEQFFFNLIELHSKITENLSIKKNNLEELYEKPLFKNTIKIFNIDEHKARDVFNVVFLCITDVVSDICSVQINRYKKLQQLHNEILGHYFRNLYHILKTISESKISDKKKYSNILRSQLSTYELTILLVNCLNDVVDDGQFKKLIIEFEFFEHLPLELTVNDNVTIKGSKRNFINFEHLLEYMPNALSDYGAFGRNPFFNDPKIKRLLTKN